MAQSASSQRGAPNGTGKRPPGTEVGIALARKSDRPHDTDSDTDEHEEDEKEINLTEEGKSIL